MRAMHDHWMQDWFDRYGAVPIPSRCPIEGIVDCIGSGCRYHHPYKELSTPPHRALLPPRRGGGCRRLPATRAGLPCRDQHARLAPRRTTGAESAERQQPDGGRTGRLAGAIRRCPPGDCRWLSNSSCCSRHRKPLQDGPPRFRRGHRIGVDPAPPAQSRRTGARKPALRGRQTASRSQTGTWRSLTTADGLTAQERRTAQFRRSAR